MKRGFFGQKGNVFAFLAMAIILLAFMLLLARHEPLQMPKDSNTESKVETAVQENITRTVRQTTQNFATSGYSKQSSAWVCNAFQPPVANEVDSNFRWMLYNDINNILFPVMQKELGYEFSPDFDVKLGISQEGDIQAQLNKVLSLDGTKVDMNVSFITVKTAGKNEERKLSNSYFISFPYRKWLMYKKYVEWGQAHLDELGPQVCNELTNAHQCVFNACGDHDKEILITDDYINGQIDLSKLDIEKYVQKQLDYLNSITKPENIECEIPIVTKPDGTTKLDISMATEIVIARMQKCSTCDKPKFASTNMPGCAAMEPSDLGCDVRDKLGPWLLEPGYPPTVKETVQCNDDMNKQEAVAANSNLAFSFQFICKDKTRSIPFDAGVEESTSKISVVARITRTCPVAFFDWEDGSNPNPEPPPNPTTTPPQPTTTPPQPTTTPPPNPTTNPPKSTFNFIFVPVNWSASNAAFKQVADESYSQFIQGAEISSCSSQYSEQIVYPDTNNCQVSSTCSNSALNKIVSCAQKAGYSTSKTNARVVGIVQGSICPGTNILGFTTFSSVSVICTYADPGCAAHELGHTFYMCEQYCYNTGSSCWLPQNKTLNAIGGCKNYYPDGKTHCEEYGSLTTKCPEVKSGNIDCLGRKIPMGGQVGRSLMGPGLSSSIPRAFDCFETDTLKAALDCQ